MHSSCTLILLPLGIAPELAPRPVVEGHASKFRQKDANPPFIQIVEIFMRSLMRDA
jgi:hypothetical protein